MPDLNPSPKHMGIKLDGIDLTDDGGQARRPVTRTVGNHERCGTDNEGFFSCHCERPSEGGV